MTMHLSSLQKRLVLIAATALSAPVHAAVRDARVQDSIPAQYSELPLAFEANRGQSDPAVKFQSRGAGYGLYLTGREALIHLSGSDGKVATLRTQFVGGNPKPEIFSEASLPGHSNYLTGADSSRWITNVDQFGKVRYSAVYPGIDVVYYGTQRQVEYDFVVAPGADPRKIRMRLDGAKAPRVNAEGDLVIAAGGAELIQHKPVAYQMIDGQKVPVEAAYKVSGNEVSFDLARYDRSETLVIDPLLALRVYAPGLHREIANAVAVDGAGAAYIAGYSIPYNFVSRIPLLSNDVFVTKLNPSATAIEYATYIGGAESDVANDIAVDALGQAYVVGQTYSNDFPVKAAAQSTRAGYRDGFALKLSADGKSLIYSTYLGGVADDTAESVAVDVQGSAYITGTTASLDFPTQAALQAKLAGSSDAFVTKLLADGPILYSTYLGGKDADGANSIAVGIDGSAYVTGMTLSKDFPSTPGVVQPSRTPDYVLVDNSYTPPRTFILSRADAFVTKLSRDGASLSYSTYLGGLQDDSASGIAVDAQGNAYVTGRTQSPDFPLVNAFRSVGGGYNQYSYVTDSFVAKLTSDAGALVYSTYLGGNDSTYATGIAVDGAGRAWVTGYTSATTYPTHTPLQRANSGNTDAFVTGFNAAGTDLVYSSYLGASSRDFANAIALDSTGNIYLVGYTLSNNFTNTKNPQQGGSAGQGDAFVTKIAADFKALSYSTYLGDSNAFVKLADGRSSNPDQSGLSLALPIPLRGIIGCTLRAVDGGVIAGTELLFPNHALCDGTQPTP